MALGWSLMLGGPTTIHCHQSAGLAVAVAGVLLPAFALLLSLLLLLAVYPFHGSFPVHLLLLLQASLQCSSTDPADTAGLLLLPPLILMFMLLLLLSAVLL